MAGMVGLERPTNTKSAGSWPSLVLSSIQIHRCVVGRQWLTSPVAVGILKNQDALGQGTVSIRGGAGRDWAETRWSGHYHHN